MKQSKKRGEKKSVPAFDAVSGDCGDQKAQLDALVIPEGEEITVHMVHLNHLDLTWYWRLPDTIEMCLETIRWHVELLEKHPDARYSHTQVFVARIVEKIDPPLFRRFARLVRAGRIEMDSGQVVEPDHNMPSGESLARQFLYGQRYLESRFGSRAETLVNSDSFGHCRSLPQIAGQAGMKAMLFKRPRQKYVDLPEYPFLWKGIDGTTILALRFINNSRALPTLSDGYIFPEGTNLLQEKINRNLKQGVHHLFASHCNSDAGGVTPYVRPCSGKGYALVYDTPTRFFSALAKEKTRPPVIEKPLNYIYQGCYTSHIHEKENCRRAERELREVELLWSLAALAGNGYPMEDIRENWWRLCFLQFHDIVTGTGIAESHKDSRAHYHELFLNMKVLRKKAQLALDRFCRKTGAVRSFLVSNPNAASSDGIVETDVEMPLSRCCRGGRNIPEKGFLEDGDGRRTPYQIVAVRQYQRYIRGTMLFRAAGIPSLGLKTFHVVDGKPSGSPVRVEGCILENEHLRVEVGGPGIIRSLAGKRGKRSWLKNIPAPVRLELWPETNYIMDYGSSMKAWQIGVTDKRENARCAGKPVVVENGPVRATIRVVHRWGRSTFTTDVSLCGGQDWVEIRTAMDWREKEVLVRLCVEPKLAGNIKRTFSIPFGYETATGKETEVAATGWTDISGDDGGVALLSRDRPGNTFRDDCLRVSLVRCATGDWDPCTDSGHIESVVRILPHLPAMTEANIPARADEFLYPLIGWQSEGTDGKSEMFEPPLIVNGKGIRISAFKATEEGDGFLVRLYESIGRSSTAELMPGGRLKGCAVFEANLIEDKGKKLVPKKGKLKCTFVPFEIKTLIFKTKKHPAVSPVDCGRNIFSD